MCPASHVHGEKRARHYLTDSPEQMDAAHLCVSFYFCTRAWRLLEKKTEHELASFVAGEGRFKREKQFRQGNEKTC